MTGHRITQHPILPIPEFEEIEFFWEGKPLTGHRGETIAAALFANGIHVFGHHHKDQLSPGYILRQWAVLAVHGHCRWQAVEIMYGTC